MNALYHAEKRIDGQKWALKKYFHKQDLDL